MTLSLIESISILMKVIIKIITMALQSALLGVIIIGIGTIVFKHKQIVKFLRKL